MNDKIYQTILIVVFHINEEIAQRNPDKECYYLELSILNPQDFQVTFLGTPILDSTDEDDAVMLDESFVLSDLLLMLKQRMRQEVVDTLDSLL